MKKVIMKRSILIALSGALIMTSSINMNSFAQSDLVYNGTCYEAVIDDVYYKLNETQGYVTAKLKNEKLTEITVRGSMDDYPVRSFHTYGGAQHVKVLNISTGIEDVDISDCNELVELNISSTVKEIDISYCPNLAECNVDKENEIFSSNDGVVYDKSGKTLFYYPSGKPDKVYIIPEGVEEIGSSDEYNNIVAIDSCKYLEDIVFPDSLKRVNGRAVVNNNFEYLEFPTNVTSLDSCSFAENKKLKEVVIHENLLNGSYATFDNCDSLEKAVFLRTDKFNDNYYKESLSASTIIFPDCYGYGVIFGDELYQHKSNVYDMTIYVPDSNYENYQYAMGNIEHYTFVPLSEREKSEPGDVNMNGRVEIHDIIGIQKYFVNRRCAGGLDMDVNGDENVNIVDVLMTKQYVSDAYSE